MNFSYHALLSTNCFLSHATGSSVNSVNTLVRTKSCCSTISCPTPTTVLSNVIFVNILHQKKNSWSPTWPSNTQVSLGEGPPSYVLTWPVDSCPGCLCCLQGRSRSPALCVILWPSTGRIYASTCSAVTLRPLRSGLWPTPRSLPEGGADLSSPCSRLRSSNNNMTAVQGCHAPLWACDTFLIMHHYPILDLFVAFFTFCGFFMLLYKVTVDSATLQAMQGVESASVSQDTLGNTTIIYEQGWHCCPWECGWDYCNTAVVWHVCQFYSHAPQLKLIYQPKMPFTCCWTWATLGSWLETLYRLVLWLLTTLTDTVRWSKTAPLCSSRLQW